MIVVTSFLVIRYINQRIVDVNCEKVLEVTQKGATIFKNELKTTEQSLRMFTRMLPQDTSLWKKSILAMIDVYKYYRITIVTEDGSIISNDNISSEELIRYKNRHNEDFSFSKTYTGESGKLQTLFSFSFEMHGIRAHLYAERLLDRFYNNAAMVFFGSDGFSYVISGTDGKFLLKARNRNSQGFYADLYSMLLDSGQNAPADVARLRALVREAGTGTALMRFRGEASYLCFVPIQEKTDWYFLSIIPQKTLEYVGKETSLFIVCLVTVCLLCFWLVYILSRRSDALAAKYREQAFRDSTFNAISTSINTVIAVYNAVTGETEFLSENSARILGLDESVSFRETFLRHCRNENLRRLLDEVDGQRIERFASDISEYIIPSTGEILWLRMNVYKIRKSLAKGKYILTIEDITEDEKKSQLLHDAMLSAQRANDAKSAFLANMSHEIRTPMNAIIGMTVLAQMHLDDQNRVRNCLTKVAGASRHLLGLINDILDMSKIASGKITLSIERFSLSELIDDTVAIVLPQINAKGHRFEVRVKGECDATFEGDPLRIQQMLINIIGNAIKYTPENGLILLNVSAVPRGDGHSSVTFVITDNGIGMSEEYQKVIFEPFSQERAQLCQGTGIGMAITHSIVQLMGGTIHFTSRKGEGTSFTVGLVLPVSGGEEAYDTLALTDRRALLADDDSDVGNEAVALLKEFGMDAEFVTSGETAVDSVRVALDEGKPIEIIILDWKMPGMDGLEAAKAIRELVGQDVSIIILSAYDWSPIEKEAAQYGINAFISKPLFKSKLYHTLMGAIKPNASAPKAEDTERPFLGRRFILAEDNELNIEIASEILSLHGAEIIVAVNGKEAVDLFASSPANTYDLILMDVQMPVCDGYEATKAIRALEHPDAATIPIIAMTANAFKEDEEKAYAVGMNGYLTKPIDIEEVCAMLTAFLKNR